MLEKAKETLKIEAASILELLPRVDEHFQAALEMILHCKGRIIVTGMGKSGIIGRKIAATLASTGTPAFYLHPAEGIHGDLGMVTQNDVILALSNSGETGEVLNILPSLRRIGAHIISMVGNPDSTLAKNSDIVLNVGVQKEACPLGLAPTSSTTAALAFGDALAMELLSARHFTPNQFAIFHPGGSLGRKLLLTVADIMHKEQENPMVPADMSVKDALFVITDKGVGAVSVVDDQHHLLGLVTDGDIRRGLARSLDFLNRPVAEMMTAHPTTIAPNKLAAEALHIMEANKPRPITVLPVVDEEHRVVGLVHITDLVHQGVV
ncbi:KpsF/GutQ family sugar-phosphate isomerase [Acidaminococcus sp. NSJ-142]|jgi:arabinose-5-phosphate isomerase|uniref:KpsF/GutQ family sugar-phosphate isomerase n=1 Tax=Acidaminococcus TaxID=904 RepID=UPI000CF841BF|nr:MULTISPECIES: KpsF/GutQ family sugar-phosphate isomerase [Acidaminococcus]MCD2435195.1 KpsF/GutQ family sugar-phosphate isomerase [Acidaminococcus hominis]MCH4097206.1 KpsF/GutQ family sugar-phosphate isomerase [Acidaminococcus provencensis]RHK02107.1 KpsF/GutQ family sugar-phosphate isomerase [Acidaminococcus sp. AM05-11]